MKLVLCDDDPAAHDWIEHALKKWSEEKSEPIQTLKYLSAEALLFDREAWVHFDGLILDIEMKAMNGMQLAREIRHFDKHIPILFITGYENYVFEGYEVGAVSYLLKPINEGKLGLALEKIYEISQKNCEVIFAEGREGCEKIALNELLVIESEKHHSLFRMADKTFVSNMGINKYWEQLMNKGFCMPHRSFIVNIGKIRSISKNNIHLDGGLEVPIARGKWADVNQSYLAYYRKE